MDPHLLIVARRGRGWKNYLGFASLIVSRSPLSILLLQLEFDSSEEYRELFQLLSVLFTACLGGLIELNYFIDLDYLICIGQIHHYNIYPIVRFGAATLIA